MTLSLNDDMFNLPAPNDIELAAADRRRRERRVPDWLREAIIAIQDARDEKDTQQDALR